LDPVIYNENFQEEYKQLIKQLAEVISPNGIRYLSLGVVRFTKNVFHQMKKNYPDSSLLAENFVTSFDNKVRYIRPLRIFILNSLKKILIKNGFDEGKIYLCMENT
jgi:spore photoproduct lyase